MSLDLYHVAHSFFTSRSPIGSPNRSPLGQVSFRSPNRSPSGPLQVTVGISGGVDSIVLLDLLHHIAPSLHLELTVVHVHHGLRGADADADAAFVRSVCEARNIPCIVERVDVTAYADEHHCGIEAAARALRYQVFERVAKELQARYVAVGHTADDVAETMLMHLARGSGVDGMSAQRAVRMLNDDVAVVRPLLSVQRSDIIEHARTHALTWREDASNTDLSFLRNMVRSEIMPKMRAVFGPDVTMRMAITSELLEDASMIVSDVVAQHVTDPLDVDQLHTLPSHLLRPIIREFLKRGMGFTPSYVDVQRTLDLLDAETGSHASLSGNHMAFRERSTINLAPGNWELGTGNWHLALGENKAYVAGSQRLDVRTVPVQDVEILPDPHVAYIDADRLNGPLVWRTWEDGDRFVPFGMQGSVLVSDLLTNAKVPFSTRRTHRVVADADGIVWLCGIRPAERTRVTASTANVLILSTTDH